MDDLRLRTDDFLEYRFEATSQASLWLGRQLVAQWLVERAVRQDVVPDLLVVVNELCTAAVDHRGDRSGEVRLRVWLTGTDVEIEVEDWCGMVGDRPPDLRLAAALVDEVVLRVRGARTVVRARAHAVVLPRSEGSVVT